jgi:hypothetical protein
MRFARFDGYVHASGTDLVDGSGTALQLHGVGLGNWLLPEGYMWGFGDEMASPWQIEARFAELVGPERAAEFWRRFRAGFITEADVARIAALGFDHVRLPFNARGLIDDRGELIADGVAHIDRLVDWCEAHGLWVLLDLHGAPGGQTGTNIDDSVAGKPELFMNPRYRDLTLRLWRAIAQRYRDRTCVLGYDLLNEPLPNHWQHVYGRELMELYADLTATIREVDPHHLIMYEGVHWATDFSAFTEPLDPNSALQFHRYWCAPERAAIAHFLEVRERLQLPIYMGEGGENTPEWIYAVTRLYERHGIGWNFWPWKKLDTTTSPLSMRLPDGWDVISAPTGAAPDPEVAWRILESYLAGMDVARCDERPAVTEALFARGQLRLAAWSGVELDEEGPASTALATAPDSLWQHGAGQPYSGPELALAVDLAAGDALRFVLAERPGSWTLDADDPEALHALWDGGGIVVTALRGTALRALTVSAS